MEKLNYILNGEQQTARPGTTILDAAREAGVKIPTLCYLKQCNAIGACRVCLVEVKGAKSLMPACVTKVTEGMEIITESPDIEAARKESLERICGDHYFECEFCARYSDCELYMMMIKYGVDENHLKYSKLLIPKAADETAEYLVRDPSKCIMCRRCVGVCKDVMGIGALGVQKDGEKRCIGPAESLDAAGCVRCGQCVAVCPTGALFERNETRWVWNAINAKDKYTVAIVSPYTAAAFAEKMHFPQGEGGGMGKLVSALRDIGFDAVFDASVGIDMAARELAQQLKTAEKPVVSWACSPFNRLCAAKYPEIAVARSMAEDFAGVCRNAVQEAAQDKQIYVVSIGPCTAEKQTKYDNGLDAVLTTNEAASMWRRACVSRFTARKLWKEMEPSAPDAIPGTAGGQAVSATGGILELALQHISGKEIRFGSADENGVCEAAYETESGPKRAAFVTGLGDAQRLLERLAKGDAAYDAIEVMACPNGCIAGGGQPRFNSETYSYIGPAIRKQALEK